MNILIVRVSSLGDVIHNMPMVADIRRHYPQAQIDWVVEEAYVDLVRMNGGVRHIIPFALRRWRKTLWTKATRAEMGAFRQRLQSQEYDIVFDTQGLIKTSVVMRLARLAAGGKRVGLANATEGSGYEPLSRIFHTQSVPVGIHTHAVDRARLVAAAALKYPIDSPADFNLQLPPPMQQAQPAWMPAEPYAVFFHATARAAKRWQPQNWIEVAHVLEARGMPILLPWGSEAEREAARELAQRMPNARLLPKLPMMDAVLLARRAVLAIGVDTGLTHIAAAFCRPTIELYCDSPRWKTEGNWSPNIINLGDRGGPPTTTEVIAAIEKLCGPSREILRAPG